MTTLLLAERPFGDMLSRATMTEALRGVPHEPPFLLASHSSHPRPGFQPVAPGDVPEGVTQVVLAGAFQKRQPLEQALATAAKAVAAGARLLLHNLTLASHAGRRAPPLGVGVLDSACSIAVRDHRTADTLMLWRVAGTIRILGFPERHLPADASLTASLPEEPVLGVAIEALPAWQAHLPAIRRLEPLHRGWPVLPLPVALPGGPEDDLPALRQIPPPDTRLLLPELGDPAFWRGRLTPARLKGLVARCAMVVTNRDLVASLAVASGVPVLGVALGTDRRIGSCLATLANELPPGSALLRLAAE